MRKKLLIIFLVTPFAVFSVFLTKEAFAFSGVKGVPIVMYHKWGGFFLKSINRL